MLVLLKRASGNAIRVSAAAADATRAFSSTVPDRPATSKRSLITHEEGVHQTMTTSKAWKNKPLFRRQGDVRFKTGLEAANLLVGEAKRRDDHEHEFIDSIRSTMQCLSPIFDRNPKYAFVAKQLMEPERFIQFRVAWIDDIGVVRMNRGFRIQYSSSLGPYEGALHFGTHVNSAVVKALGFDSVFSNALTGFDLGAAAGGSDFNPFDKSEGEMQRFCQSYMTELAKYVGPDTDSPWMGMGVGEKEMGYLFGQYKRINMKGSISGRPFLSFRNQNFYKVRVSWQVCQDFSTRMPATTTCSHVLAICHAGSWIRRCSLCGSNPQGSQRFLGGKALSHSWIGKSCPQCR